MGLRSGLRALEKRGKSGKENEKWDGSPDAFFGGLEGLEMMVII